METSYLILRYSEDKKLPNTRYFIGERDPLERYDNKLVESIDVTRGLIQEATITFSNGTQRVVDLKEPYSYDYKGSY